MSAPIRLIIADDHPVVRGGLRGMFADDPAFTVVGEAANGEEVLALVERQAVDVILMDLRMPVMDGVAAIRALRQQDPAPAVLVLTTYDSDSDVIPAIEAGAIGYLLKDAPRETLVRAIAAATQGETVLSPSVASRLMRPTQTAPTSRLSEREREVLALIAMGATNKAIAASLFISEATVKTHLIHLYAKLGVQDRAGAVGEGYRRGLLS